MNRPIEFNATLGPDNVLTGPHEVRASDNVISVQITNPGTTPTVVFEVSNNGGTWVSAAGRAVGTSGAQAPNITAAGMWAYMVQWRFWRLRSTAGSGTITGVAMAGEGWTI